MCRDRADVAVRESDMQEKDYWFRAKRYGWGWGLPVVWQGWLVYGVAFALLAGCFFAFPPEERPEPFLVCTSVVVLLLLAVCWWKGEPPRWRWGK